MSQEEFDELEAAATSVGRPLQRDGHRVDDGGARRGARDVAARGRRRSRRSTRAAHGPRRRPGARAVELAREELRPSRILTARGVRQRDHGADGDRRRRRTPSSTCSRSPGRVGVPLDARPLRRALAPHAGARRTSGPSGEHLVEELHRAGGDPRRAAGARAAAAPRRADGDRQHARRELAGASRVGPRRDRAARRRRSRRKAASRVVRGSLAPDGAIIKRSAAVAARCFAHRGPRGRLRGHLRRGRADRRPGARRRRPTRCSCCATRARRAARACRSGGSCRSRRSCSRAA